MAFVQYMLSVPSIPSQVRQDALDRAHSDPGIPNSANSTSSFWLKCPDEKLAKIQSDSLPSEADVVIIGSGITSVSVAKTLLESGQIGTGNPAHPKVVVVEARDVCSGATGRNGGHILETAEDFADLVENIGLASAKKVTRMRLSHLDELVRVAEEFGVADEAQVRRVEFLSAYFDEHRWRDAVQSIELFQKAMPSESEKWRIIHRHEIPKDYSLSRANGIISGPAGALWPYKFVTAILSRLLERYPDSLKIETNTPVSVIFHNQDETSRTEMYEVVTSRGSIRCRHVIHCTNAHVAHLVPSLLGRVYPTRGHMSAQSPGNSFISQGSRYSWLFNYRSGFDYLTQLPAGPHSTNEMMLGGGFAQSEYGGIMDIGVATDDETSASVERHLSVALDQAFDYGSESHAFEPKIASLWAGNMGFSADGFPWVGRLPESCLIRDRNLAGHDSRNGARKSGEQVGREWVCAGFTGEGMVHAWKCGAAVATMLLQDDGVVSESDTSANLAWFPEQMLVTEERLQKSILPRKIPVSSDKIMQASDLVATAVTIAALT